MVEQTKEVYFAKYQLQDQSSLEPKPPGGTLLKHNFGDVDLSNQNNSVCGINCGKPVNGVSNHDVGHADDIVPVSLIAGIRDALLID